MKKLMLISMIMQIFIINNFAYSQIDSIIIGDQVWMVNNLNVGHYRNGDSIPEIKNPGNDPGEWRNPGGGACCNYNNSLVNGAIYGKLYNWFAVNDSRGLAPAGWHIPTSDELNELYSYLGGLSSAGGKLKESGTSHWQSPNTGTNESGFSALPGGFRGGDYGQYKEIGTWGNWWTSTEYNAGYAAIYVLVNSSSYVTLYNWGKLNGISVRCISDYPAPENSIRTSSITTISYCEGESISIPFTITGTYNSGNIFTAQLSNSSGNFSSPTSIGTFTSQTSGTINGIIPSSISGTGFRVRVVSSNPVVIGSDNGVDIAINPLPTPQIIGSTEICKGRSEVYNSNTEAGLYYEWSVSGGTINGDSDLDSVIVDWDTDGSGTITLIQTTAENCTDSSYTAIIINPLPTPQITGDNEFCNGESAVYNSNTEAGLTYEWTVSGGTINGDNYLDSVVVDWDTDGSGTVTLIQTTTENCTDSSSISVTINPLPTPQITGSNEFCKGELSIFNSNTDAGLTYEWTVSGGTINGDNDLDSVIVDWDTDGSGTITLTQTTSEGCSESSYTEITINPLPIPQITGDNEFCNGESAIYNSNTEAGLTYEWTVTGGTINGDNDLDSIIVDWDTDGSGTITLTQTTSDGCSESTAFDITVNSLPVPIFSDTTNPVCEFNTYNYSCNSEAGESNMWYVEGGTIDAGANTNNITVTWGAAGLGSVKVINSITATGCKDSIEITTITIEELPDVDIIGSDIVGSNRTESYQAKEEIGLDNIWTVSEGSIDGSNSESEIDVEWGSAGDGTLKLVQTNQNTGCKDSIEIEIEILDNPPVVVNVLDSACENNLSIYSTSSASNLENKWTVTGGDVEAPDDESVVTVQWGAAGQGTIKVLQHNTELDIWDSLSQDITIHPLPEPGISGKSDVIIDDVEIYSESNNYTDVDYSWELEGGGKINGSNSEEDVDVEWQKIGKWKLKLILTNKETSCIDSTEIEVNVQGIPDELLILGEQEFCVNEEETYTASITGDVTNTWEVIGGEPANYNGGSITVTWKTAGSGEVKLIQEDNDTGDLDTAYLQIDINPLPDAEISGTKTVFIDDIENYTESNNNPNVNYKWQLQDGGKINGNTTSKNVEIQWQSVGKWILVLIIEDNDTGCADTVEIEIDVQESSDELRILGKKESCVNQEETYTASKKGDVTNTWEVTGGSPADFIGDSITVTWGTTSNGDVKLTQEDNSTSAVESASLQITINQLPDVTLDVDSEYLEVCVYEDAFELVWGSPVGGTYYINDIQKIFFDPDLLGVGEHSIKYEYENEWGCSSEDIAIIIVHPRPIASPNADTTKVWSETGASSYEWYYNSQKVSEDSVYYPFKEDEGEYFLKVFNEFGCESELSEGVIYFPPDPEGPRITSKGVVDFETLICESSTEVSIQVNNVGAETLSITNAEISGDNKDYFSIVSPAPATNIDIEAKQSEDFIIKFEPRTVGEMNAELIIESNDTKRPTYTINISGKKDSVGFELSDSLLNFEVETANSPQLKDIVITNTGSLPLYWQEEEIGTDFEIISIKPNPTEPNGDISTVRILFNGAEDGYTASKEYLFTEGVCNRTVKLILQASVGEIPVDGYVELKVDSILSGYKPGDIVEIPIYLHDQQNLDSVDVSEFKAELHFNSTMLVPFNEIVKHEGTESWINLSWRIDDIKDNVLQPVSEFTVVLGNDTSTVLTLENPDVIGDAIEIRTIDGLFKLDGFCMEGGYPRLISTEGILNMKVIRPNPASESFTIDYEVVEDAQTEIYIVNSFGERIKTVVNGEIKHGKHSEDVNVNEFSSGLYFIILETPTFKRAVKVEIVK